MGLAGSSGLSHRCAYGCAGATRAACASESSFESWAAEELQKAFSANDVPRVRELVNSVPVLKERELSFPGEQSKLTALALALNRRDAQVVRALLDVGVSPNLPISEEQRAIYAHRSHLAALNGGDPDIQYLTPTTHFEALCCTQHKEFFSILLEKGANPNSGIIPVCHCGDLEMLEALLARGADPNFLRREMCPLVTSVKSKLQPYEKVLALLRAGADPNLTADNSCGCDRAGPLEAPGVKVEASSLSRAMPTRPIYPALTLATRKRDYRMVRILLEAGADANRTTGGEGLPSVLFWATYWGELELVRLFVEASRHPLDLGLRKYTGETIFDVATTSQNFARAKKPRHIAKLPLPSRPAGVYEKIVEVLEQYRREHPSGLETSGLPTAAPATGSTTATTLVRGGSGSSGRVGT